MPEAASSPFPSPTHPRTHPSHDHPPTRAGTPVRARRLPDSDSDTDWVDLWGGISSDEEEEGGPGGAGGGGEGGLGAVVDVDQQYAEALERWALVAVGG